MQAQNMMWPPALATALTALINVPVNLVLIRYAGFEGAAAAFSVSRVIMFLVIAGAHSPSLLAKDTGPPTVVMRT